MDNNFDPSSHFLKEKLALAISTNSTTGCFRKKRILKEFARKVEVNSFEKHLKVHVYFFYCEKIRSNDCPLNENNYFKVRVRLKKNTMNENTMERNHERKKKIDFTP